MIFEMIYLILFTSVTVLAFKIATSEDMIFEGIGKYAESQVEQGKKYFELIQCPFCMPSLFTFGGWIFVFVLNILPFEWNYKYIALHLVCVFTCCILCGFTWVGYTTLNAKKGYYEAAKGYYDNAEILSHFEIKNKKKEHYQKTNLNSAKDNY